MGESFSKRIYRALQYSLVIFIVILSGYSLNPTNLSFSSSHLYHISYSLCICFIVTLGYVNVYIYAPNPYIAESPLTKRFRRTAATLAIFIILLFLFILPTVIYSYWFIYIDNSQSSIAIFIFLFLVIPSIFYCILLFRRSGHFYSQPDIQLKLFDFRNQLITPALLFVTVPFAIGYILNHTPNFYNIFLIVGLTQTFYILISLFRPSENFSFKILGELYSFNFFFISNLILFVFVNTAAYFIEEIRFLLVGLWFGIYMMSFEFWTSLYFKETENKIRIEFGKDPIDLNVYYQKYYVASASSFTFLLVLFPLTFLFDKTLTLTYLWVVMLSTFFVWHKWLRHTNDLFTSANNIDNLSSSLLNIKRLKFIALAPSIAIVANYFSAYWIYLLPENSSLTNMAFGFGALYFALLGLPHSTAPNFQRANTFYWLGGILMIASISSLLFFYDISKLRIHTLQANYFYLQLIILSIFMFLERKVIFSRFYQSKQ